MDTSVKTVAAGTLTVAVKKGILKMRRGGILALCIFLQRFHILFCKGFSLCAPRLYMIRNRLGGTLCLKMVLQGKNVSVEVFA